MSLKRILGVMLASRMAGRGRRRGSLGSAALLGGLGGRGLRGKAGVAALGYMAYQAYRDHQSRQRASGSTAARSSSASGTGLSGIFDQIAGALGGEAQTSSESPDPRHAQAADEMSDDRALLLIRGMVAAAHADGELSQDERHRISGQLDEAEATADERRLMMTEIEHPKPLDTLLAQINDHDTAVEFYLASRAAVDSETEANRAYLTLLRNRLNITEEEAREAEELAP